MDVLIGLDVSFYHLRDLTRELARLSKDLGLSVEVVEGTIIDMLKQDLDYEPDSDFSQSVYADLKRIVSAHLQDVGYEDWEVDEMFISGDIELEIFSDIKNSIQVKNIPKENYLEKLLEKYLNTGFDRVLERAARDTFKIVKYL